MPNFQSFDDFKNRYLNRFVEKETERGMVRVPARKFWLEKAPLLIEAKAVGEG